MKQNEYAEFVDYIKLEPFKRAMIEACKRTVVFPNRRGIYINEDVLHAHGGVFRFQDGFHTSFELCQTTEGLGHKNWIAEWMYKFDGTGNTYYESIGIDTVLMAVNDNIAQGAMPITYTDEVAGSDSDWFTDEQRSGDLANGFVKICEEVGAALIAGESPSLPFLINPTAPVTSAPSLSGTTLGIVSPAKNLITGAKLQSGDHIIAAAASGMHSNGSSLVIKYGLRFPEKFMTKLPNGNTFGEEILIPTLSYVRLIEELLNAEVDIHALLPSTGDGVAKIAYDNRPFTYRIFDWFEEIPPLFLFMMEKGATLDTCLKTFNWGAGFYIYVPESEVAKVLETGQKVGYELQVVGRVEEGERKVIFEPEKMTLPPPGE